MLPWTLLRLQQGPAFKFCPYYDSQQQYQDSIGPVEVEKVPGEQAVQDDTPAHAGHTRQQPSAAERDQGHTAGPPDDFDHNTPVDPSTSFRQIMNYKIKLSE
jgi:hypothetical protein